MYNACVTIVADSRRPPKDEYDPAFVLALLAAYINKETISYHEWIGLSRCGVLGLPICALSSPDPSLRLAGDRVLARMGNKLQVRG